MSDSMPELPEVESMRRILEPDSVGHVIEKVVLIRPEIVEHPGPDIFIGSIEGKRITSLGRRGKYVSIDMEDGGRIWFHLRMTGRMYITPRDSEIVKHTHIIMHLDDGNDLRYVDPRRFGRFWYLLPDEEDTYTGMAKLGAEPLDGHLCSEDITCRAGRSRRAVKECLLDQSIVAGIGNIYADEILFDSEVCPTRPACSLSDDEWERITENIPLVLRKGLEDDLESPEWYLSGREGSWEESPYRAYGREGEPCVRCGKPMVRTVISNRSSYYCPCCQK